MVQCDGITPVIGVQTLIKGPKTQDITGWLEALHWHTMIIQ